MNNYMPLDFATWIRQAYREPESTSFTIHNMEVAYQAGRASHGQAPAQPAPAAVARPVAVLKFERGTPGRENEMPRVVSCNWMPDGEYDVYFAAPQPARAGGEPLTPKQVAEIADAAHREYDRLVGSGQCAPRWSAVFAHLLERAHGISVKGGA